jgi:accessory gene regulator B
MWTNPGLVERLALAWAKSIHNNGGHPDVSVGTMRYALQLWISALLIFAITAVCSAFFGNTLEALTALIVIGFLRYFSGGWHFRSLELCICFTVTIATAIPMIPDIGYAGLVLMNGASLLLVLVFAPTGHGQQFRSDQQRMVFRLLSIAIVAVNLVSLSQVTTAAILIQSLTLISCRRG